ncbi:MAG TPA: serine hydrolase domain-containing protein [Longimicrobiales bacterium]|nr:serine hydrolase domain-containing protein [Longimicrobiales bacterium]
MQRRHRPTPFAAAVALAAASLPAGVSAQVLDVARAPAWGPYQTAVDSSRHLVAARMEEVGIPGLSIAVARDGEVVWSEGFGFADLENRVPVTPATKFRIASISKALTASAVGELVQEGRLDLDATVQRYVPSFPEKRWPVTVREIGGHLAGIRHYRGEEFASAIQYDDVVDALEIFARDTLLFEPGTRYSYSTYGWNLMSAVIQGASGVAFLRFMRENVIEPLGLRGTVAEHVDSIIPFRARFYERTEDGRIVNAPYVNNSNKWAGGGYLSTAEDLVRYGSAYFRGDFLDPATVELLWTPQHTSDGESTGYGIGWSSGERPEGGGRRVWHTGGAMGGSTILMIYPDERIVVSILTNVSSVRHTALAAAVADLFATVGS